MVIRRIDNTSLKTSDATDAEIGWFRMVYAVANPDQEQDAVRGIPSSLSLHHHNHPPLPAKWSGKQCSLFTVILL